MHYLQWGPFAPWTLHPLHRYYDPLWLPTDPLHSYAFLQKVGFHPIIGSPWGPLYNLSMRAHPNHPGCSHGCICTFLHRGCQVSPSLAGWPTTISVTRPKRVHFIWAHIFAVREQSTLFVNLSRPHVSRVRLPSHAMRSYMSNVQFTYLVPLN